MATTGQGPASTTVTRSRRPSSWKTWVIPTFRPRSAAIRRASGRHATGRSPDEQAGMRQGAPSEHVDLVVHARGEVVEPLERVDRLRRRLEDVDQALVRTDLEVLARVLVLEGTADHAVAVLLRGQRHGPGDGGARAGGRLDDLASCLLDRRGVVGLEPDADLVLG